jgi:predicted nucleic-acid-binding Zn-ribbon protein
MKNIILNFTSKENIAEFILACRITDVSTDMNYLTVTGSFTDECLKKALDQYKALVCKRSDYTE